MILRPPVSLLSLRLFSLFSLFSLALGSISLMALTACGGPDGSLDSAFDPESESHDETDINALLSDPWQSVFAVRSPAISQFIVNPIGSPNMLCPDGVIRSECGLSRLNLARMGLSVAQQSTILSRVTQEPATEDRISVLMKGALVNVRDRRTNPPTSYWEFRAERIHLASNIRTHGTFIGYIAGPPSGGFYPVKMLNSDLLPRAVDITYAARLRWGGPGSAPAYATDRFVAISGIRNTSGSSSIGLGPYEFDVDQIFRPFP